MIFKRKKSNVACDIKSDKQPQIEIEVIKAIHRTNNYNENYDIVDVICNPTENSNSLAKIRKEDGTEFITGGILCEVNPITISVLDKLSYKEQWEWLCSVRKEMINNFNK